MAEDLAEGSEGDAVKALQTALNARGAEPPLVVDGMFGPETLKAVKHFQGGHSLEVDGIVGPKTKEALASAA